MITKLTKQQEDLIPVIRDKWLNKFYSNLGKPIKKEKARKHIEYIYERAGYKKPIVWFYDGSPFGLQILVNILQKFNIKNIGQNIWQNIRKNIMENIRDNIWDNINTNILKNIRENIWENIWDNIEDNIRDNINTNILKNIRENIWENIWENIMDNIGDNIWNNVEENIKENIGNNLDYYIFNTYMRFDDVYWVAYYDYFQQAELLDFSDNKDWLNFLELMECNIGATVTFENICFVCSLPEKVNQNARNRLHNEHGMAIKWSDGWGLYALNGVIFPEELYKKVISRNMETSEILKIKDIDQRTQALKFAKSGIREFYKSEGGKIIDHYVKLDKAGRPINYELWEIPEGKTFTKTVHFAIYDCPSALERGEKLEYVKGVPAFETVADAMAWGMSNDEYQLTGEEWKKLVPLIDEA